MNSILVLCGGHPFCCDDGLGYHVAKRLWEMGLPENVECVECGYSASEVTHIIDGKDKMIFVDAFRSSKHGPGTGLFMKPEEVEMTPGGISDVPKMHLMEVLHEIAISGKCPETVFVGVVPHEINKLNEELTPEIAAKVPEVIDVIMKQIKAWS